jgi:hypothetical protein
MLPMQEVVASFVHLFCDLGASRRKLISHLVEMHPKAAFRQVVSERLNLGERHPFALANRLEQRKGDQPRVDYDMRKQEEPKTAEPDMVELEHLKEVVLDRVGAGSPPAALRPARVDGVGEAVVGHFRHAGRQGSAFSIPLYALLDLLAVCDGSVPTKRRPVGVVSLV